MKTESKREQAACKLQLNSLPHRAAKWVFFLFQVQGSLPTFIILTEYIQLDNREEDRGEGAAALNLGPHGIIV